ncbi:hypothetical protein [Methylovulum psychrotolerans]
MTGTAGNDRLDGRGGIDTLIGGWAMMCMSSTTVPVW